jgi:hypothetical protein
MNRLSKSLLVFSISILGFASVALALSQTVRYKPWGVPDNRRGDYEIKLAELNQQAELRDQYSSKPKPAAKVSAPRHDLGWVSPGESIQHCFTIENVGDDDLKLKVHRTNLSGISASLDQETLAPGEWGQCTVGFVAETEPSGKTQYHTVTIATNDPLRNTVVLTLQSKQKSELVLPKKIDFGSHDITEASTVDFVIYSQRYETIELLDVANGAFGIQWDSEPVEPSAGELAAELAGKAASAACRLKIKITPRDYGKYADSFRIVARLDQVEKEFAIDFDGRVRPPIGFYGPNIDKFSGIDFGTLESGEQHDLFVTVRSRGDRSRSIEVLDIKPKELQTELQPLKTEGTYRLRISVPKDCPSLRFNLAGQHGFIQVGDPLSRSYSNWMPIYGAVAHTKQN